MSFIRSISGIRATIGNGLDISELSKYIIAFANLYGENGIVFGNDGRSSGKWLSKMVESVLDSMNVKYINLGIAPTPNIMLIAEKFAFSGGISITASHNPIEWNGLKFINGNGVFLNQEENNKLWGLVENKSYKLINEDVQQFDITDYFTSDHFNSNKSNSNDFNSIDYHINEILNLELIKSNIEEIRNYFSKNKFKVVVDAVNSSGSLIVPKLLNKLGIEVISLFCNQELDFPHTPEPLTQNLTELIETVKTENADLGIAIDPDGDRLVVIDKNGVAIGEENTIVLSIYSLLESLKSLNKLTGNETIVVNSSTTSMVEKVSDLYNLSVFRSAVGEINVVELMKSKKSIIGGEGSGGVILPALHYSRDAMVGIALILNLIYIKQKTLVQIIDDIGSSVMLKDKMQFTGSLDTIIDKIKTEFSDSEVIVFDGVKIFTGKYEWVQLRKSNTEPIIRIIAESDNESRALQLIEKVKGLI